MREITIHRVDRREAIGWPHVPKLYPAAPEQRDFTRRLSISEAIKREMRKSYAHAMRSVRRPESFDRGVARSIEFWSEYDSIGQLWVPEDPCYTGTRAGVTLSTSVDLWTLTSPSAGQVRVLESYLGGENTASTVERFAIQRSTSGTTATNQTPELLNTRSPAASSTFATTWSAQPTLSGVALLWHAFNTFGGTDRWVPQPGEEIYLVNAEKLSGRSASGTAIVSSHLVWEEL